MRRDALRACRSIRGALRQQRPAVHAAIRGPSTDPTRPARPDRRRAVCGAPAPSKLLPQAQLRHSKASPPDIIGQGHARVYKRRPRAERHAIGCRWQVADWKPAICGYVTVARQARLLRSPSRQSSGYNSRSMHISGQLRVGRVDTPKRLVLIDGTRYTAVVYRA